METVQNARYTKQGDERKAYPRVKKLSRFQNKDKSIHFHLQYVVGAGSAASSPN